MITFAKFSFRREGEYYRDGDGDGGFKTCSKSAVSKQLISKQFALRRGDGSRAKDDEDGQSQSASVSAEDEQLLKTTRLTAAASTSVKIAGLKLSVSLDRPSQVVSIAPARWRYWFLARGSKFGR